MKRLSKLALLVLCLFVAMPTSAKAEAYPEKPINLVVPFGAGSGADRYLRLTLPYIQEALGDDVEIVIDYKTGGGGVIGSNFFMTKKHDGYSALYYNQPHITIQQELQKVAYSNETLYPVLGLSWRPDIITVKNDSKFKTFQDLYDYAKANPGGLTIGTTGSYSSNHLLFALLEKATGLKMTRIPFDSGAKMNVALLGNQIDAAISNMQWLTVYPGELRALVSSASERPAPDVPTFTELGYPEIKDVSALTIIYLHSDAPQEAKDFLMEKLAPLTENKQLKADFEREGIPYGVFDHDDLVVIVENFKKQLAQVKDILGAKK